MRVLTLILLLCTASHAQELSIQISPQTVYVENIAGNITPIERVFFHVILENTATGPIEIRFVRFNLINSSGAVLSGQYSGAALTNLFDSSIDRRRIEPTAKGTVVLQPRERKMIADIFMDCPIGFIGESLVVEAEAAGQGRTNVQKVSSALQRVAGFAGRLPFDGVWYVSSEHGFQDRHKRFLVETFAYDFLKIGANGQSYQRDGSRNSDYYAYGQPALAAKDGAVTYIRSDIVENVPGSTNLDTPGGNVVIIDHGQGQYSYYGHLRPNSITVRLGDRVRAGAPIAEIGNSGDSLEPHLHFHVMNKPDPSQADGIPAVFESWKAQAYGRVPVVREMGILPRGEFVQP